jgi:hypothetical protein
MEMGFNELKKKPQTFIRSEAFFSSENSLEADTRSEQEIKSGLRVIEVFCGHRTRKAIGISVTIRRIHLIQYIIQ